MEMCWICFSVSGHLRCLQIGDVGWSSYFICDVCAVLSPPPTTSLPMLTTPIPPPLPLLVPVPPTMEVTPTPPTLRRSKRLKIANKKYFNETKEENVHSLHVEIVAKLREMLDTHNVLVQSFRMIGQRMSESVDLEFKLKLIGRRTSDPRVYNLPSVGEVAALIVGDLDQALGERDILVQTHSGPLKRISELNAAYLVGLECRTP
ncbi:hypothetical protein DM860_000151 [Cuscuta australis]|uniref:Uncharacterized protein n=1 Tax=Cuscuta australis TaxID=267555 RepID=A0A328CVR1_9ASTE|nr:hypothetical protein DM860_000151 [Cuscuta australis]